MIYGKVVCRIPAAQSAGGSDVPTIMLTVAHMTTIKQGTDIIRLTWDQLLECQRDLADAIAELTAQQP